MIQVAVCCRSVTAGNPPHNSSQSREQCFKNSPRERMSIPYWRVGSESWREPGPSPRRVHQTLTLVVSKHECVKRIAFDRISANNKVLTAVHAHLLPCA